MSYPRPILLLTLAAALVMFVTGCDEGTSPADTDNTVSELREQIVALTNEQRAAQGLDPLSSSTPLDAVAQAHAVDMVQREFFDHTNPDGDDPFDRIDDAGIPYQYAGENIAYYSAVYNVAGEVVQGWMNSPGHRANILNANYHKIGVGAWQDDESVWYFVQVFTN